MTGKVDFSVILFMRRGVQMKYVCKLTDAQRTSRENGTSPLDCADRYRGSMSLTM